MSGIFFFRSDDVPLANSLASQFSFDHAEVLSGASNQLDSSVMLRQPEAKKRKVNTVDHAILKCLKHLDDKQPRALDEEELFGMHIAAVLRRLTNRQKAMARLRIQQVLTDVEFPESPQNPCN